MLKINIKTTTYNVEELAEMLEQVIIRLDAGFTSGHYPIQWNLEEVQECEICGGRQRIDTFTSEGELLGDKPCPECTNVDDADYSGSDNEDR